jgi:hypothetical protein
VTVWPGLTYAGDVDGTMSYRRTISLGVVMGTTAMDADPLAYPVFVAVAVVAFARLM